MGEEFLLTLCYSNNHINTFRGMFGGMDDSFDGTTL